MMMEEPPIPAIVIDYGSDTVKAGFSGAEMPNCVFKSLDMEGDSSSYLDNLEVIFRKILINELKTETKKHPILLTEVPLCPKPQKEQTAQLLFEKFAVPALSIQVPGVLSLFSTGRLSGLVFDSGDRVTYTLPVSDGHAMSDGVDRIDFAGRDLTAHLSKMLNDRDCKIEDSQLVRELKEQLCYVAFDYTKEFVAAVDSKTFDITHKLPDGNEIKLGVERFRCPETFFRPKSFNFTGITAGISEMIFNTIAQCDVGVQRKLFPNIYLTGGSTQFQGFGERMQKEIAGMTSASKIVKVISPQERILSAWLGGSLVASHSTFHQICVTKREFEEFGPTIIREKFALKKSS